MSTFPTLFLSQIDRKIKHMRPIDDYLYNVPVIARERGYILLFTLGTLAVLSVLILSMVLSLRLDAQLGTAERVRLNDEYRLTGAANYAVARLNVVVEARSLLSSKSSGASDRGRLWTDDAGPYSAILLGKNFLFEIEDAVILPDANLLTEQEWKRLLLQLGLEDEQKALELAKAVVESRIDMGSKIGGGGFATLQDLMASQILPQYLTRGAANLGAMGLSDLVVVGTERKQIEINKTPLTLFSVLADFNAEQLSNLQSFRKRGFISQEEGQKLLYPSAVTIMTSKSPWIRLKIKYLNPDNGNHSMQAIALLKLDNEYYKIFDLIII